jgi:endoglucanase
MTRGRCIRTAGAIAAAAALAALAASGASAGAPAGSLAPGTRFSVRVPDQAAVQQIGGLLASGRFADAALLTKMETVPQATWVTKGTPTDARKAVQQAVALATAQRAVPVLVAYDIPGRDCANLSAGGATSTADYEAWIDGFARGIGNAQAVVILEPDALGLLPSTCGAGFPFTDADRYTALNAAVDRLEQQPNVSVYLDWTHTAWLNVGDAASRLVQGGVLRAQGFFLNVSNYQYAANNEQFGTWISRCIAHVAGGGSPDDCANQYWNGGPDGTAIATLLGPWTGVALSRYGVWSDTATDPSLNTSGINARYAGWPSGPHFVIDTSRDGLGPWNYDRSVYPNDGAALDWCNAPGRGLGPRPAAQPDPANTLLDAYLWVKTPGESDGTCNRNFTAVGSPDPEWGGIVDPAAGQWFPQEALQLAQLASPPLLP